MVRSVNVKKTKSSKKIVLKITMSMTPYLFGCRVLLSIGEGGASGLLHPSEARTPNIGAGRISLDVDRKSTRLNSSHRP